MIHEQKRTNTIKEKQETFSKNTLSQTLRSQNYAELSKQKEKWTDSLFPPQDGSLYSGKTEFSNHTPPNLPNFLKVNLLI
jgi:hypothetical protein